jgi:putative chitinase
VDITTEIVAVGIRAALVPVVGTGHADAAATEWAPLIFDHMAAGEINTPKRLAMALGMFAIESAYYTKTAEDLDYRTFTRLHAVWPAKFPIGMDVSPYLRNPEALANYVYATVNGNHLAGDGWLFRGRGLIEITGRGIYQPFAETFFMTPDQIADRVSQPDMAAASACWYWKWQDNGALNVLADKWLIPEATKVINGGDEELDARRNACNHALAAISAHAPSSASSVPAPPQPEQDSADALMAEEQAKLDAGQPPLV